MSWRQYACVVNKRLFTTHQRLNEEHLNNKSSDPIFVWIMVSWFYRWRWYFHISKQVVGLSTKWTLSFKLTQSLYNLRILNYIKKN